MWARWDGTDYWQPTFAAFITGSASMFQVSPQPYTYGGACNPRLAQSPHSSIMQTALGDGSVRSVSGAMSGDLWWSLCTPSGNEVINDAEL
jgi:hypothetical protein